jgi:hypothetical protein
MIADKSGRQGRRQAILSSVPHLLLTSVVVRGAGFDRQMDVTVMNAGPSVAYGVLVSVAGLNPGAAYQVDSTSYQNSGRRPSLASSRADVYGVGVAHLYDMAEDQFSYGGQLAIHIEYYSPLGAKVILQHSYWIRPAPEGPELRLVRVEIDAGDGDPPQIFEGQARRFTARGED